MTIQFRPFTKEKKRGIVLMDLYFEIDWDLFSWGMVMGGLRPNLKKSATAELSIRDGVFCRSPTSGWCQWTRRLLWAACAALLFRWWSSGCPLMKWTRNSAFWRCKRAAALRPSHLRCQSQQLQRQLDGVEAYLPIRKAPPDPSKAIQWNNCA